VITSVAGVVFYQLPGYRMQPPLRVASDWFLGALFGVGGLCGMYPGAARQKYIPVPVIKLILFACMLFVFIK
jgi:uncharacterized protein